MTGEIRDDVAGMTNGSRLTQRYGEISIQPFGITRCMESATSIPINSGNRNVIARLARPLQPNRPGRDHGIEMVKAKSLAPGSEGFQGPIAIESGLYRGGVNAS